MFPNLDTNVNTAFRHVNWEQYPTGPTKLKSASFYVHPCYQGSVFCRNDSGTILSKITLFQKGNKL